MSMFDKNDYKILLLEKFVGAVVSALRCVIVKVKQHWSVIGWVTKNLLCRAPPCFGKHVKPLLPAAFAIVSTHQPALGPRGGLWPAHVIRKACTPAVGTLIG
jgi:hypothetical protein